MKKTDNSKFRKQFQKIIKISLIVFVIVSFSNLSIDNPYTHRLIQGYLKKTLSEKSKFGLSFNGLSVSVFPLGIEAYGLTVINKNQKTTALNTTQAKLRVSLKSLLVGKLKLSVLEFENSIIDIDSLNNLISQFGSSPPPKKGTKITQKNWPPNFSPFLESIEFKNLVVKNAEEYLITDSYQTNLNYLNFRLNINDWDSISGKIELADLSVQDRFFSLLERGNLELNFDLDDKKLDIHNINLTSARLNFTGKLGVKNIFTKKNNLLIGFKGDTSGDLSTLGSFLDMEETAGQVSGNLNGKIIIPKNEKSPIFEIFTNVKSNKAKLYGFKLLDTQASLNITNEKISFDKVKIYEDENLLADADGKIEFSDQVPYSFNINPKNLDLSRLLDILTVDFSTVDGTLTKGSVNISGTSTPYKMKVSGPTDLSSFNMPIIPQTTLVKDATFPNCDVQLELLIDSKEVNYGGTSGVCYDGSVNSDNQKMESSSGELEIRGKTSFNGTMDLDANLTTSNLKTFSKFLGSNAEGSGFINTNIKGPYRDLKISIDSSLEKTKIVDANLGKVIAKVTISPKKNNLVIKSFSASLKDGNLLTAVDSTIDFGKAKSTFKINAKNIDNAQTQSIVDSINVKFQETNAHIDSLSAKLDFDLDNFDRSVIELDAQTSNVFYHGQRYAEKATGKIKISKNGITTKNLKLDPTGSLELVSRAEIKNNSNEKKWSNIFSPETEVFLSFKSEPLNKVSQIRPLNLKDQNSNDDVSNIQNLPFLGKYFKDYGIAGHLGVDAELSGKLSNLNGVIDTRFKKLKLFDAHVSPIKSKIFIENDKININFSQSGATLLGNLSLDFSEKKIPYETKINFKNFDIKFLFPASLSNDARNFFYSTGSFSSKGNFERYWESDGELNIEKTIAQFTHTSGLNENIIDIEQKSPIHYKIKDSVLLSTDEHNLQLKHNYGNIELSLEDSKLPESLSLSIKSQTDLIFLNHFFEEVEESKGSLIFNSKIFGNLNSPTIQARVRTEKNESAAFGLASARPSFQNGTVDVEYDDGKVIINNFSATKGPGKIVLTGSLNLNEPSNERIDISISNANFNYDAPIVHNTEAFINGDLYLTGHTTPFRLNGTLEVEKARANKNINLKDEVLSSVNTRNLIATAQKDAPLIEFDINLIAKDTIRIENKSLNLTLGHDLKLQGDNNALILTGILDIASGKVTYKKDYSISRGIISFEDRQKIDPSLDISAFADISNHKVTVDISGRSSSPTIEFSVDPPTRDDGTLISRLDTLILMATGKLPDAQSTNSPQDTLKFEAANAALVLVDQIAENLIDPTDQNIINQIYFDAHPGTDGSFLLRANAPINTGNDLDLILQGDQEKWGVKAEYDLEETISTSVNFSRTLNNESATGTEENEDVDATIDLRFRFLFP
jgi:hypothetical protein